MGGKKKQSLRKAEKTQKKKPAKKEKKTTAPLKEKKAILGITPPTIKGEKLPKELQSMKVITPFSVATRYELRLSIARKFLKELEQKGLIRYVSKSQNLTIYTPAKLE